MLLNIKTFFESTVNKLLSVYDLEEAKSIVFLLMESVLRLNKIDFLSQKEMVVHQDDIQSFGRAVERLQSHEPVQYIIGEAFFYENWFFVDRNVLIPRQETEELVDWIVKSKPGSKKILDIGTGSGCIIISLDLKLDVETIGWDVSAPAIEVAHRNATSLGAKTIFKQIDILDNVPPEKFDLIVSNPPYVLAHEKGSMHKNVLAYEPERALFVPDRDPLLFYRRIVMRVYIPLYALLLVERSL